MTSAFNFLAASNAQHKLRCGLLLQMLNVLWSVCWAHRRGSSPAKMDEPIEVLFETELTRVGHETIH